MLTKETADKLMAQEGEARGMHLWSDAYYIREQEGERGIAKVEGVLAEAGYPIRFDEIKRMDFYPLGYRSLSILAMQDAFDWGEEEIKNLCRYAAGVSLIVRLYMKFFYSFEKVVEKAPEIWEEYFSTGELTVPDYSKEERYIVVRIEGADLHPSFCRCMDGYLEGFIKMVVKTDEVRVEEERCAFEGDNVHEYRARW